MSTDTNHHHLGSCLCGDVQFEVNGPLRDVIHCHCTMCQKLHGGCGPHTKALKQHIKLTRTDGLAWYQTSEVARRGFCSHCGSGLFWEPFKQDAVGILAGVMTESNLNTLGHIYVSEKASYVAINDGTPQFPLSSEGQLEGDHR